MIPKIIHYCWLSNDPFPEIIQKCIDSWKKYLPDYELMLWNFNRFSRGTSKWVDQAFDSHKYAFAADYIRLYALYHHGGIYLDSDVEVLKSFNDLLHLPYFVGQENTTSGVEAATMGFEKGHPLIKALLNQYEGKNFINPDGTCNDEALPYIIRRCIETRYDYIQINNLSEFVNDADRINILPIDWFSPKHWQTREINCTDNTYSIHHFAASWKEGIKEDDEKHIEKKEKPNCFSTFKKNVCRILCEIATRHSHFARIFIPLYSAEKFYLSRKMWVYAPDYKEILRLQRSLRKQEIEFITPEQAHHIYTDYTIVPVAKVTGTNIEIYHSDPKKYELVRREDIINEFKSL